jgi:serine/threonine-protein kinase
MESNLIGAQLGNYRIQAEIELTVMGSVYEAVDLGNERPVMVRTLDLSGCDRATCRRFRELGQTLSGLDHPNILKIYDYGVDDERGLAYLVVPFVGGATVEGSLGQPWPVEDAVHVGAQIARALDSAHQQGIVHGDVRPSNVLVTERGWPLLTGFELAHILTENSDGEALSYGAVEESDGKQADVYALAAILYTMLSGRPPFQAPSTDSVGQRRPSGPPPLRRLRPEVPAPLAKVVSRALSKDREKRYATAIELARALEGSLSGGVAAVGRRDRSVTPPSGVEPVRPVPWRRLGRFSWRATKWILGKAIAALIVLALVAMVLLAGAVFALSAVAEQALANQTWTWYGLEDGGLNVILEDDLQRGVEDGIEPYALGALTDLHVDFRPPDAVAVHSRFRQRPLDLRARLSTQNGVLHIQLERLNGVPLYIVGGIVSNGVNKGLRSSWEGAPVRLTSLQVRDDRILAGLAPRAGYRSQTPRATATPRTSVVRLVNELDVSVTVSIAGEQIGVGATEEIEITVPADTYLYTVDDSAGWMAEGEINCPPGRATLIIR